MLIHFKYFSEIVGIFLKLRKKLQSKSKGKIIKNNNTINQQRNKKINSNKQLDQKQHDKLNKNLQQQYKQNIQNDKYQYQQKQKQLTKLCRQKQNYLYELKTSLYESKKFQKSHNTLNKNNEKTSSHTFTSHLNRLILSTSQQIRHQNNLITSSYHTLSTLHSNIQQIQLSLLQLSQKQHELQQKFQEFTIKSYKYQQFRQLQQKYCKLSKIKNKLQQIKYSNINQINNDKSMMNKIYSINQSVENLKQMEIYHKEIDNKLKQQGMIIKEIQNRQKQRKLEENIKRNKGNTNIQKQFDDESDDDVFMEEVKNLKKTIAKWKINSQQNKFSKSGRKFVVDSSQPGNIISTKRLKPPNIKDMKIHQHLSLQKHHKYDTEYNNELVILNPSKTNKIQPTHEIQPIPMLHQTQLKNRIKKFVIQKVSKNSNKIINLNLNDQNNHHRINNDNNSYINSIKKIRSNTQKHYTQQQNNRMDFSNLEVQTLKKIILKKQKEYQMLNNNNSQELYGVKDNSSRRNINKNSNPNITNLNNNYIQYHSRRNTQPIKIQQNHHKNNKNSSNHHHNPTFFSHQDNHSLHKNSNEINSNSRFIQQLIKNKNPSPEHKNNAISNNSLSNIRIRTKKTEQQKIQKVQMMKHVERKYNQKNEVKINNNLKNYQGQGNNNKDTEIPHNQYNKYKPIQQQQQKQKQQPLHKDHNQTNFPTPITKYRTHLTTSQIPQKSSQIDHIKNLLQKIQCIKESVDKQKQQLDQLNDNQNYSCNKIRSKKSLLNIEVFRFQNSVQRKNKNNISREMIIQRKGKIKWWRRMKVNVSMMRRTRKQLVNMKKSKRINNKVNQFKQWKVNQIINACLKLINKWSHIKILLKKIINETNKLLLQMS